MKPQYYRNLLSGETLSELKQRVKDSHSTANKVVTELSSQQMAVSETIHQVFSKYGKPSFLKSNRSGGIIHDVVLYKRLINGLKSKVIYHFVNESVASICYTIQVTTQNDEQLLDHFLKGMDTGNIKQTKKVRAAKNIPYEKPKEISLTFINHNPEVIQNINAAVYIDKYSNATKYLDSSKFQLTF
jgi:hypothetical protein